jgi:hypothetical protein
MPEGQEPTSMIVVPMRRWINQTIRTPWDGPITRNGNLPITVPARAGKWLIDRCFAELYVEGSGQTAQVAPLGSPEVPQPLDESAIIDHPKVEDIKPPEGEATTPEQNLSPPESWQTICVERLNGMSADEISQIRGISAPMAELISNSKPLNWEKLSTIVNERQIKSLQSWIDG